MSAFRVRMLVYGCLAIAIAGFFAWLLLPSREKPALRGAYDKYSLFQLQWYGKGSELEAAIVAGNTAKAKTIMAEKPKQVTQADVTGVTPLHWAAYLGNVEVADALLDKGADINAHECWVTPLGFAISEGHLEVVRFLCDHGAILTTSKHLSAATYKQQKRPPLWSPLNIAVFFRRYEVVDYLLSRVVDVNDGGNSEGVTPLMMAVMLESGDSNCVSMVLAHGADVNKKAASGRTALHLAASSGHVSVAELLLNAGADINSTDLSEQSPIYEAISRAQVPMVELLIARGASLAIRNKDGQTPREYAAWLSSKGTKLPDRMFDVLDGKKELDKASEGVEHK